MRARTYAVVITLGVGACGGSSNPQGQIDAPSVDATGTGTDAGLPPGYYYIQQIESPSMAAGTPVGVTNVVVTAIDSFGKTTGNFWVEEPGGGQLSGILVYEAPASVVETLTVGSVVTVANGEKSLFASTSDKSGNTDPQIVALNGGTLSVTALGTATVPAPAVVDALTIGQMQGSAAEAAGWAAYNGVLVTVSNVSVLSHPECEGSCKDNTDDSFEITGALATVESQLAALPGAGSGSSTTAGEGTLVRGDCLASVTGVIDYDFTYNLLPLATTDIASGGSACPAPEQANGSNGTLCTDGIDNDGNGFTDCADLGCEVGSNAWLDPVNCTQGAMCGCSLSLVAGSGASTVNAGSGGVVILNDVFVTAVASEGFWIADSAQAAATHGMFVFQGSTPTVTVGEELTTVQGVVKPFGDGSDAGDLTELELDDPTVVAAGTPGTVLPIIGAPVATVTSVANGSAFQGSLVQFTNVSVLTAPTTANHHEAQLTDGTTTFVMDDEAFEDYGSAATGSGTCYTSLTGVMDLDTFDPQVRTINPRSLADMVVGTGCPAVVHDGHSGH